MVLQLHASMTSIGHSTAQYVCNQRPVVMGLVCRARLRERPLSRSASLRDGVQIVGMSATLPNLDLLARWLDADLYRTDFRPVPLTETVKVGRDLFDADLRRVRRLMGTAVAGDDDHLAVLCLETLRAGHSVLIFCPTKNWCEKLAELLARQFSLLSQGGATSTVPGS